MFTLEFESTLAAPPDRVWRWATSVDGILAEMRPLMRMTVPRGVNSILDLHVEPGKPLARCWVLLFGFIPIDRSDLTLVEIDDGRGFVEESPMLSMRRWRHERTIEPVGHGSRLTDRLTFEPRLGGPVVKWFISVVFRHRHAVLRRGLGAGAS